MRPRQRKPSAQTALDLRSRRGGARPGAGRKPRDGIRAGTPHVRRPAITRRDGIHVTLRVISDVGRLRRAEAYRAIRGALAVCLGRTDFRIVEASIQHNHIHLMCEADDKQALANGVRAFMISATQRLNRLVRRRGVVFDRYHMTVLSTPRQVRHCYAYVLNNWRRHREHLAGAAQRRTSVDPYSSGPSFTGWRTPPDPAELPPRYDALPVAGARSWLLTEGWRRHHPVIDPYEVPGPALDDRRRVVRGRQHAPA